MLGRKTSTEVIKRMQFTGVYQEAASSASKAAFMIDQVTGSSDPPPSVSAVELHSVYLRDAITGANGATVSGVYGSVVNGNFVVSGLSPVTSYNIYLVAPGYEVTTAIPVTTIDVWAISLERDISITSSQTTVYGRVVVDDGVPFPSEIVSAQANGVGVIIDISYNHLTGKFHIPNLEPDTLYIVSLTFGEDYMFPPLLQIPTAPANPTDVVVIPGSGSLRVAWNRLSGRVYTLEALHAPGSNGTDRTVQYAQSPTVISNLENGVEYSVRITVQRKWGGDWVMTMYTLPGTWTPTDNRLSLGPITAQPIASGVQLSWAAVTGAVSYIVTTSLTNPLIRDYVPAPIVVNATQDSEVTVDVTGLTNGMYYNFAVVALPDPASGVGFSSNQFAVDQVAGGRILATVAVSGSSITYTPTGAGALSTGYAWSVSADGGSTFTSLGNGVIVVPNNDGKMYKVVAMYDTGVGNSFTITNVDFSTKTTLAALSVAQIASMKPSQASQLSTAALASFSKTQVAALSTDVIGALAQDGKILDLGTSNLGALNQSQMKALVGSVPAGSSSVLTQVAGTMEQSLSAKAADIATTAGTDAQAAGFKDTLKALAEIAAVTGGTVAGKQVVMTEAQLGTSLSSDTKSVVAVGAPSDSGMMVTATVPAGTDTVYAAVVSGGGSVKVTGGLGGSAGVSVAQTADGLPVLNGTVIGSTSDFVTVDGVAMTAAVGSSLVVYTLRAPIVSIVSKDEFNVYVKVTLNQTFPLPSDAVVRLSAVRDIEPLREISTRYSSTQGTGTDISILYTITVVQAFGGVASSTGILSAKIHIGDTISPQSVDTPILRRNDNISEGIQYATPVPNDLAISLTNVSTTYERYVCQVINKEGALVGGNVTYFAPSGATIIVPNAGNYTVLIYPVINGTNIIRRGAQQAVVTVTAATAGPVCFLGDAPVLTPRGYRPIREFRVGDAVTTADGRVVTVTRVFQKKYGPSAAVNPYVIPKGFLGSLRPIALSPNHEVLIPGRGMVKAQDLGLRRMKMAGDFVYYNLELENWGRDHLVVGGVAVESLAPATMTKSEYMAFMRERRALCDVRSAASVSRR